jgi:hypothetical protein
MGHSIREWFWHFALNKKTNFVDDKNDYPLGMAEGTKNTVHIFSRNNKNAFQMKRSKISSTADGHAMLRSPPLLIRYLLVCQEDGAVGYGLAMLPSDEG